jgi:hypothetical protein
LNLKNTNTNINIINITFHNMKLYGTDFQLAPYNGEIKKGDFSKLPIEIFFHHFLLIKDNSCLYVGVVEPESQASFEIFEVNLDDLDGEEKTVAESLVGSQKSNFLRTKILKEGYNIFVPS